MEMNSFNTDVPRHSFQQNINSYFEIFQIVILCLQINIFCLYHDQNTVLPLYFTVYVGYLFLHQNPC
jgi:hypothetical protein